MEVFSKFIKFRRIFDVEKSRVELNPGNQYFGKKERILKKNAKNFVFFLRCFFGKVDLTPVAL